jgi:hypothetical protein
VLLNKECGNVADKLHMYKITWSGKTASISDVQTIPLSKTYSTPNARLEESRAVQPAPGGRLRADEPRRTDSIFAHRGSVFGCNGAKRNLETRPGILWYEVRMSDGALLQEGFVDDPTSDFLNPSLAVDRDGNIGLGCTRTSEREFPSVYVMMHAPEDVPGIREQHGRSSVVHGVGCFQTQGELTGSRNPARHCLESDRLDCIHRIPSRET